MDNYGNYGNPYPYPPYGYPPPPFPQDPQQAPPPRYLLPSSSFPSPPIPRPTPALSHSGPLHYPPPPFPSGPPPPHPHSYQPYPNPYSQPYPTPYDSNPNPNAIPDSSSFHHESSDPNFGPVARPSISESSSSSSLYPIDSLLADMRLSSDAPTAPPLPPVSAPPASSHHYHHSHSFSSGSPAHTPSSLPPSTPFSPAGSQHGSPGLQLVPFQTTKASLKVLLLHGSLDIWVLDARSLPNMDMFSKTLGDMLGQRLTSNLSGKLERMSSITSDPYVSIVVSGAVVGRTYVISNSENPVWMHATLLCARCTLRC